MTSLLRNLSLLWLALPSLIRYAYDFEQITGQRKDPALFSPLP
jgi:hypothetical protein